MTTLDLEPDDTPKPARQKWEEELEEILAASDRDPTAVDKARSKVAAARYQTPQKARSLRNRLSVRWSSGMWLVIFVGLVVLTFAVRHVSPLLGRMLAIAAVVLLIVIIGRSLMRPAAVQEDPSKMWRGRNMAGDIEQRSWFSRLFDRDKGP